jgi:hypothetical protein
MDTTTVRPLQQQHQVRSRGEVALYRRHVID